MLEETYHNVVSFYENWNWKKECYISLCRHCGNIIITTSIIRCPVCESGNILVVPFRDHPSFSFRWLDRHGFSYIKELLKWSI